MSNAQWPTTLPDPLQSGTTLAPMIENVLQSTVDTGRPKRRRRFTYVPDKYTTTLSLSGAQVAILRAFIATTLQDTLPFNWKDPTSGAVKAYVFGTRPTYTYDDGFFDSWTASLELWEA